MNKSWWWLLVWIALCGTRVFAHGPLDHSARITVMDDSLEVVFTLGPELVEAALKQAGLPDAEVAAVMAWRGPSGSGVLGEDASAALVALRVDGVNLRPIRAVVLTDGLEYLFEQTYSCPSGETLDFFAKYLEAMEQAPHGVVEFVREDGREILVEDLSVSRLSAAFSLQGEAVGKVTDVTTLGTPAANEQMAEGTSSSKEVEPQAVDKSHLVDLWPWGLGSVSLLALLIVSCGRFSRLRA